MAERARSDADGIRLLALTVPGLARLARRELASVPGVQVTGDGNDGRADVLLCTAPREAMPAIRDLRTVEDVFIELGRTQRSEGDRAGWISGRLWRNNRAEKAVSTWFAQSARAGRKSGDRKSGGSGKMTYRVIVRVLHERSFHRTQLRDQLTKTIARDYPSWRVADPARLEVWALEYAAGRFVAGLRVSDASMRQRQGRTTERSGALRPAVAAAMVREAGAGPGVLLDPCCGSGTILSEAKELGWDLVGRDIDGGAIDAARSNVKGADLATGDVRRLDRADASVGACVSNLPFGRQFGVDEDPSAWLATVLGELARVTVPGGRIVLLVPAIPRAVIPPELRIRARHSLRLLGVKTTMWVIDRA